jgi:hypothetical protein
MDRLDAIPDASSLEARLSYEAKWGPHIRGVVCGGFGAVMEEVGDARACRTFLARASVGVCF